MVATEGEAWKRYRSVAKPAFNEANNALVWRHSTRVVEEWFEVLNQQMENDGSVKVDLLKDCTELTLLIFSSAAFGKHNAWSDHSGDNSGHRISFRPAATSAVQNLVPKVLTPDWLVALAEYRFLPLPKIIKEASDSFMFLRLHMLDIISSARDWVASGNEDDNSMDAALLQNLVKANLAQLEQEESKELMKRRLTDQEVLSNAFMFLLAGHETSAHSMCFAICLMALYPEVQEKMYRETKELWPDIKDVPTGETVNAAEYKDDMSKLEYVTAVFRENLRLFPPVPRLSSPVRADTTLTSRLLSTDSKGHIIKTAPSQVNLPAGSLAVIDIIGVHKNPICWGEDAEEFNPERFIDTESYTWPRDAFLAFSAGLRGCMGERFAMVESVCTLAHITRKYKVTVPEDLVKKPWAEQKKILLHWTPMLTLIPHNASVCFTKRHD
ncbi:cytochrome P450 [Dendrothele bispora CBS 962.96]|uniref:Cytochrome P450 n=1 Tax=Dendrothele bispora (strain CBS 962.96) TaxID=1314807 RepID=A0A4S8LGL1_DENBC|nr:cytochrome P450 [Dendrothele bispora CBS 962.96]